MDRRLNLVKDVPVYQLLPPGPLLKLGGKGFFPGQLGCQLVWGMQMEIMVILKVMVSVIIRVIDMVKVMVRLFL